MISRLVFLSVAVVSVFGALAGAARPAFAQDRAAARALFEDGRKLAEAKNFAEACPKFQASLNIDPKLGTKLALASCYEEIGRTASAWAEFSDAAAMARSSRDPKREKFASDHADKLVPKLVKITVNVATPVDGLVVKRDGEVLQPGSYGVAVPVDPGEHALEASAPGFETWSDKATVGTTEPVTVTVPELVKVAAPPPPANAQTSLPPAAMAVEHHTPTQTYIGWAVGGAGVVAAGVGAVFAIQASSKWSDAKAHCNNATPRVCDSNGVQLHDDATSKATLSTVFIGVGAAAIATGVVLLLTAPSGDVAAPAPEHAWRLTPVVTPSAATLSLSGAL